ncbi:hypothetical protein [Taibaiella soli]|uniref:Uncharacterized protein n=1 Tax=Taibaiella soli TaxID=1649169 RepID=A0A2W2B787_9BACT|nr:hypothetical protein [Taibaiella soli]PZF71877.1 hypothetical protein DN068_17640 [Taibaiella soli]
MNKKIAFRLFFLFLCTSFITRTDAQAYKHPVPINFNADGTLDTPLPDRLTNEDLLTFSVQGTQENINKYQKEVSERIKKAQQYLELLRHDTAKMKILTTVYGITELDTSKMFRPTPFDQEMKYYSIKSNMTQGKYDSSLKPGVPLPAAKIDLAEGVQKVTITLSKRDPFKKLVIDRIKATRNDFKGMPSKDDIDLIGNKMAAFSTAANTYTQTILTQMKEKKGSKSLKQSQFGTWTNFVDSLNGVATNLIDNVRKIVDLSANQKWLMEWLWFASQDKTGLPLLNPLNFTDPSLIKEPDTSLLLTLRAKLATRDNFIKNAAPGKPSEFDAADKIIDDADLMRSTIASKEAEYKSWEKSSAYNDSLVLAYEHVNVILNKAILMISGKDTIRWMRHHDMSNEANTMNIVDRDEYLEDSYVSILGHNLKENQKMSVNISYAPITSDQSPLADQFTGNSAIDDLIALLTKGIGTQGGVRSQRAEKKATSDDKDSLRKYLVKLGANLDTLQDLQVCLAYVGRQTVPYKDIEEQAGEHSAYHSEIKMTKKVKGPKQASYEVDVVDTQSGDAAAKDKTSSSSSDTFTYRVNKKYWLFPMAGLAYNVTHFAHIDPNSSGNGPGTVSTEDPVHFVAGLKFYINKTDIRDNRFITGKDDNGKCLFWSRTSIDVAVDVSKPLNNIYTGIGFDLIPGCCINAGAVWNKYTFYSYDNGQNTGSQQLYRCGFYVGVSTDVTLVDQILKLLNL